MTSPLMQAIAASARAISSSPHKTCRDADHREDDGCCPAISGPAESGNLVKAVSP